MGNAHYCDRFELQMSEIEYTRNFQEQCNKITSRGLVMTKNIREMF